MDIFLLLTKRPHEWPPELRDAYVRAIVDEGIAKRGRRLTRDEIEAGVKQAIEEGRAKRGYDLTPEELERRFEKMLEEARKEPPLYIRLARASGYRYEPPAEDAFVLRERRSGQTRLDRIERELAAVRERMATKLAFEDEQARLTLAFEYYTVLRERIDELSQHIDALTAAVERIDLRLLALESRQTDPHPGES